MKSKCNHPERFLLSVYYVPGIAIGDGDIAINQTGKIPALVDCISAY